MVFRARPGAERAGSIPGIVFVVLAIGCAALGDRTSVPRAAGETARSVPDDGVRTRSAGVFIGVEDFPQDPTLTKVDYAVNDAVDLAYALSVEHGLLPASQVILLLSGDPEGGSTERLRILRSKHARISTSTQADIYSQVEKQSGLVREGGLFVLSIATHGYAEEGKHLLLASDSLFRYRTGITAEMLLEATEASQGLRLLIIDACREQLYRSDARGARGGPDPRSAMPKEVIDTLTQGYAVFSAASPGGYAYPGERNGLFTNAILEGLRDKAPVDGQRCVTLNRLAGFVREKVETLSRGQQRPELRTGGGISDIALLRCSSQPSDGDSKTVYRTPSGERYHLASCRYVQGKAIPLSLEDARKQGLTPCKVCQPPPLPPPTR